MTDVMDGYDLNYTAIAEGLRKVREEITTFQDLYTQDMNELKAFSHTMAEAFELMNKHITDIMSMMRSLFT